MKKARVRSKTSFQVVPKESVTAERKMKCVQGNPCENKRPVNDKRIRMGRILCTKGVKDTTVSTRWWWLSAFVCVVYTLGLTLASFVFLWHRCFRDG